MTNIEIKILRLLLQKDFFNQHGASISRKVFSSEVKGLMKTIAHLHKTSGAAELTTEEVYAMYESSTTITVARLALVQEILKQVAATEAMSPEVTIEVIAKIHEKEAARQIAEKALAIVQRNDGAMTLEQLKDYVATIDADTAGVEIATTSTDVAAIKASKANKGVFHFTNGLEQLEPITGTLSRGHFMIVFASTNAGKSSFVAQACVGYLEQGHRVLYFGNEDVAEDIVLNLVRSVEQKAEEEVLSASTPKWDAIRQEFVMVPAHGMTMDMLEQAIKKFKPDVIVADQLDLVNTNSKMDKRHDALEESYQKARQWGSTYGTLVIAVSQASDEATGKLALRNNMLANSRIGKAGTADLILGIGMKSVDNPQRSICICKNKITGKHENIYMQLNNEICRYEQ